MRNFEAEYLAACIADRTPGATLKDRGIAQRSMTRIANAADKAGVDLYARVFDIDEQARLMLYPV
jgi:hypothetical protein